MTTFSWRYEGRAPMFVRTFVRQRGISRTLLKSIKFNGGDIRVNDEPVRVTRKLTQGDELVVKLPPEPGNDRIVPSFEPLAILFESEHFLVVNKPAGIASVPSHLYPDDTLVNRVKGYLVTTHAANQTTHIVTRLDRETSGVVIFAKHHFAHTVLDTQLKQHRLKKMYIALAKGRFKNRHGAINQPIGRQPGSFVKRMVRTDGKAALTEYWVVKQMRATTLLKLRLHTGRTHQIRVHLTALGHPLVGDFLYGQQTDPFIHRQALHCASVTFYDPFAATTVTCYAPLPSDLARAVTFESRQPGQPLSAVTMANKN
ncbi:RluA family pseudouridine synthase [Secundilactobacillus kimchicus]|nr:RluA family pseudouridine synthase [Secundilactobacillus kimchicus]MBT9673104.1 RluA family pseudouridine synthase [Secundilactobacillus kimchicus]